MAQSKKSFRENDEEAVILKKFGQSIYTSFGHFLWTIRLASPLSHNDMQMDSSLNSSTIWRLEHQKNFLILKFIEASYYYLKSIKCNFYIHHLCLRMESSIHNGKCLVVLEVDSSDLDKYDPSQIILKQKSDDIEEQERRNSLTQKNLHRIRKRGEKKPGNKSAKSSKAKKKKKKQ